mmetsp:Transcript_4659/g.5184  ORF Transcript_4659/g.5184 Transcript_4659/m.5184 type:complete len:1091 (+) Transcript_4659:138-3410(+)
MNLRRNTNKKSLQDISFKCIRSVALKKVLIRAGLIAILVTSFLLSSKPGQLELTYLVYPLSEIGSSLKETHVVEPLSEVDSTSKEIRLATCLIVKDEAPYLAQYIEHYAGIGFDTILIANDRSTDNSQCVLDAYAQKGLVTRIPEDIGNAYNRINFDKQNVGNLPPQWELYDICRRYLRNLELESGKDSVTWMFTNDVDEFLWLKRTQDVKTAKDVVRKILRERPATQSIRVPLYQFGSSGHSTYNSQFLMDRFVHRYDYKPDTSANAISWGTLDFGIRYKTMSLVSAMMETCNWRELCLEGHNHPLKGALSNKLSKKNMPKPGTGQKKKKRNKKRKGAARETRRLAAGDNGPLFRMPNKVSQYLALAHYKTKSREEFFSRNCASRFIDKYYVEANKEKEYPGCCSPETFLNHLDQKASLFDGRMGPFAEELRHRFTDTSTHCDVEPVKSNCPEQLMTITGVSGLKAVEEWRSAEKLLKNGTFEAETDSLNETKFGVVDKLPLIVGTGFGTTAANTTFEATCALGLSSVFSNMACGSMKAPPTPWHVQNIFTEVPFAGFLAHERLVRAFKAVMSCLNQEPNKDRMVCPSVDRTLTALRFHINNVLSSASIDAVHGPPYTEFTEYVLRVAEIIQGVKPIVLVNKGDSETLSITHVKRKLGYFCKSSSMTEVFLHGHNLEECFKDAIEKGRGGISIDNVLISNEDDSFPHVERLKAVTSDIQRYQDFMRMSDHDLIISEGTAKIEALEYSREGRAANERKTGFKLNKGEKAPHVSQGKIEGWNRSPPRLCMPNFETAVVSGRHCDKLVLFVHFHKAGGTSMIDYLYSFLRSDMRLKSETNHFKEFVNGEDVFLSTSSKTRSQNRLELSSRVVSSRASTPDFWWSIYKRGLDFINFEYNFLLPQQYFHVKSAFWTITMLRKPWDRFRSTFERELWKKCGDDDDLKKYDATDCYINTTLEQWMVKRTGIGKDMKDYRKGILYPNYYVRMLNGINDLPYNTKLNHAHLNVAKKVLDSFDLVLFLDEDDKSKILMLDSFFGESNIEMPLETNNHFKNHPLYETVRAQSDRMQLLFDDLNSLDNELYDYAQKSMRKR